MERLETQKNNDNTQWKQLKQRKQNNDNTA